MAATRRIVGGLPRGIGRRWSSVASTSETTPISSPADVAIPRSYMSMLSNSSIIRSYIISSISCSPILLPVTLRMMSKVAHSKSMFLNPDQNPVLRYIFRKTMYAQFCAGETPEEVYHTVTSLKKIGYDGVLLGYAREEVLDEEELKQLSLTDASDESHATKDFQEVVSWARGVLKTIEISQKGDFVCLKFTGAGTQTMLRLSQNSDPSPMLDKFMNEICESAIKQGIRLCIDAEQQSLQAGIDAWALRYMEKFNDAKRGSASIYNTYQAYLKATPMILANHIDVARQNDFALGVKLVRGAYLGSDPRHLIHDTKNDTDACYNGVAEALIRRRYNQILRPATSLAAEKGRNKISKDRKEVFPILSLVLAGHNKLSIRKALAIRSEQLSHGLSVNLKTNSQTVPSRQTDMICAQLQGMADDISCELLAKAAQQKQQRNMGQQQKSDKESGDIAAPKTYKYLVWGTTGECTKYLLRRASENKDAIRRTETMRDAMWSEMKRRAGLFFRFREG